MIFGVFCSIFALSGCEKEPPLHHPPSAISLQPSAFFLEEHRGLVLVLLRDKTHEIPDRNDLNKGKVGVTQDVEMVVVGNDVSCSCNDGTVDKFVIVRVGLNQVKTIFCSLSQA